MNLPVIQQPLFDITIPSTQKKHKFRPFLVKEEKILLIAQESGDDKDIINAIKQIIGNCIQDQYDLSNLTTFDLEYVFLKLRAKSVNNIVELEYEDNEDGKPYKFTINLDDIEVIFDPNHTNKIKVNDDITILMKYPSVDINESIGEIKSQADLLMAFIKGSIDKVYDSENVYDLVGVPEDEIDTFLDSLTINVFDQFRQFFETMPKMYHVIEYKNELGNDRRIELKSLKDFFLFA